MDPVQRAWRRCIRDRGAHLLAAHHAAQPLLAHQPLHRAAGDIDAFAAQLPPDLVGTVDLQIDPPDLLDLRGQRRITLHAGRSQGRVALPGGMPPVTGRGHLQHFADRLDPMNIPVGIDKRPHRFKWRSSSAWAKNALANFRISLALRSSRFSRSSAFTRSCSAVLTPSR